MVSTSRNSSPICDGFEAPEFESHEICDGFDIPEFESHDICDGFDIPEFEPHEICDGFDIPEFDICDGFDIPEFESHEICDGFEEFESHDICDGFDIPEFEPHDICEGFEAPEFESHEICEVFDEFESHDICDGFDIPEFESHDICEGFDIPPTKFAMVSGNSSPTIFAMVSTSEFESHDICELFDIPEFESHDVCEGFDIPEFESHDICEVFAHAEFRFHAVYEVLKHAEFRFHAICEVFKHAGFRFHAIGGALRLCYKRSLKLRASAAYYICITKFDFPATEAPGSGCPRRTASAQVDFPATKLRASAAYDFPATEFPAYYVCTTKVDFPATEAPGVRARRTTFLLEKSTFQPRTTSELQSRLSSHDGSFRGILQLYYTSRISGHGSPRRTTSVLQKTQKHYGFGPATTRKPAEGLRLYVKKRKNTTVLRRANAETRRGATFVCQKTQKHTTVLAPRQRRNPQRVVGAHGKKYQKRRF